MTIYSIFGFGKGKTESAVGITIRAVVNHHRVLVVQFLKDGTSSEIGLLKQYSNIDIINTNTKGIVTKNNISEEDLISHKKLVFKIMDSISDGHYNLIVLDEIFPAVECGLIDEKAFDLIIGKAIEKNVDVYLTGRIYNKVFQKHVIDISDIATDARCKKHNMNKHCDSCNKDYPYYYNYCPKCGREFTNVVEYGRKGRDF